jgi:hypothetical protein
MTVLVVRPDGAVPSAACLCFSIERWFFYFDFNAPADAPFFILAA